jgi:hypothetical protein
VEIPGALDVNRAAGAAELTGPFLPSSDFLNRGKTELKSQPALPASAQASYSAPFPRAQAMALMLPDPPNTLPSAKGIER